MSNKIKVAVLEEFNKPLVIREFERPRLREGEVLVRILAAGVCGSDVHIWKGLDPRVLTPLILGHEGVGIIEEISGEKRDVFGRPLKEGDFIVWDRGVVCGSCQYCTIYKTPSLCVNRWTYGISKSCNEPPYLNGCFSEAIVLHKNTKIIRVEETVDPAVLVPAVCSGATAAHSFELHAPKIGDSVLILGPGPLGVFHVAFSKELGASNIIVIGGTKMRLEMCKKFGATEVINREETSLEERRQRILELTEGRGVDVAYECSGSIAAFTEGLTHLRIGGAFIVPGFGVPSGSALIDCFNMITRKNVKIQGVWVSDTEHLYRAIKIVQNKKYPFEELITHRKTLDNAMEAIRLMEERKAVKVALLP